MRRIVRGRQLRIQLGENKGDKYANRWETKRIMCPNQHIERRTAREREPDDGLGNVYGPKAPEGSKA